MQPGDYNQLFTVSEISHEIDECGHQSPIYTPIYQGYAHVTNLSGKEYWDAYSVQQENTLQFYTRWDHRLRNLKTTDHVLIWDGKELDITSIDNVAYENRYCIIKAKVIDDG